MRPTPLLVPEWRARAGGRRAHARTRARARGRAWRAWRVRLGAQAGVRGARRTCLSSDDSRSSSRLYQKSCMSESGQVIVVSSLGGMRFSTSFLVRRIMKGRSRWPAAASCALSQVMPLVPELRLNASSKAADLGVQRRGMLQLWRRASSSQPDAVAPYAAAGYWAVEAHQARGAAKEPASPAAGSVRRGSTKAAVYFHVLAGCGKSSG